MKQLALLGSFLLACPVFAGPQWIEFTGKIGTLSTSVVSVTKNPIGYIDEVYIQAPSKAGVTSVVTLVSSPNVGSSLAPTVIYTNGETVAAAKARPRVIPTDSAGSDLSSLTVAERFLCNGDPLVFRVEQSSAVTGVTFKAFVKIID